MPDPKTAQLRAAYYCRVSTMDQVGGTSLEEQQRICSEEITKRGWDLIGGFVDRAQSGAKAQRPELDLLMAMVDNGEVDAIVVTKLDRFGRSTAHLAPTLAHLDDLNVVFVSVRDNIDSSRAVDRMQRGMLSVFAEFERELITERGVSGQRAKATSGRWPGGSPPYGWRLEGRGRDAKCVSDTDERHLLKVAFDALVLRGLSTGKTAELLNAQGLHKRSGGPWTHQHLRRQLENTSLTGEVWWGSPKRRYGHNTRLNRDGSPRYGDPIRLVLDDPPFSQEEFSALRVALSRRAYGTKAAAKPYPNSGMSAPCGGRYGGVYRSDRDLRQYRCNRAKWNAAGEARCDCPRLEADLVDGAVWNEVQSLLCDQERLLALAGDWLAETASDEVESRVDSVGRQIAGLERARTDSVVAALKAGVPSDLMAEAVRQLDSELLVMREELQRLEQDAEVRAVASKLRADLTGLTARARASLAGMGLAEQAEVLKAMRVEMAFDPTCSRIALRGFIPASGRIRVSGLDGDLQSEAPRSLTSSLR